MIHRRAAAIVPAFFLAAGLAVGCGDNGAEEAGETVDEAVEEAGDALEDAADAVEDAAK